MAGNPFDQFDAVSDPKGGNPFDQFDAPDVKGKEPEKAPEAPKKSFLGHQASLLGRAAVDGTIGLADLPGVAYTLATDKAAYPSIAGKAADALGLDKPQNEAERLEEAGASALVPGVGAVKLLGWAGKGAQALKAAKTLKAISAAQKLSTGTSAGDAARAVAAGVGGTAASQAAGALGADPREQVLAGLAGGGVGGFGRAGAGAAATGVAAHLRARGMSVEDATRNMRATNDMQRFQQDDPRMSDFQAAGALKKELNSSLGQVGQGAKRFPGVTDTDLANLATARSQANAHTTGMPTGQDASYNGLQASGIPGRDTVLDTLDGLNYVSGQQFKNASAGPFSSLARKAAVPAEIGASLYGAASGHPEALLGLGPVLMGQGGRVSHAMDKAGRVVDHVLGTAVTPAMADRAAAKLVLKRAGKSTDQGYLSDIARLNRGLSGNDPQALYEATNGDYGSPAGPSTPGVAGVSQPSAAPQMQAQRPSVPPQPAQPQQTPGGFNPLMRGGQSFVQKFLQDDPAGHAPATQQELEDALSSSGLPDDTAAAIRRGDNIDRYTAHHVAQTVASRRGHAPTPASYDAEAAKAIQAAMGNASSTVNGLSGVPNGTTNGNGPIINQARWDSAKESAQLLADRSIDAAHRGGKPKAAMTIARMAAVSDARKKAEIAQEYLNEDPEASLYFPDELYKGK